MPTQTVIDYSPLSISELHHELKALADESLGVLASIATLTEDEDKAEARARHAQIVYDMQKVAEAIASRASA